jgi:hypothetical protein
MVLTQLQANVLNISDVYDDKRFQNTRKYSTGKRTESENIWRARSILVGPVTRNGRIVGCIEMINRKNSNGEIVPFDRTDERLVKMLCKLNSRRCCVS